MQKYDHFVVAELLELCARDMENIVWVGVYVADVSLSKICSRTVVLFMRLKSIISKSNFGLLFSGSLHLVKVLEFLPRARAGIPFTAIVLLVLTRQLGGVLQAI